MEYKCEYIIQANVTLKLSDLEFSRTQFKTAAATVETCDSSGIINGVPERA